MNSVRRGGKKRSFGEQFGEMFANYSRAVFARVGKNIVWQLVRRTVRELLMNGVRQDCKIGRLANSSANFSRTVRRAVRQKVWQFSG